jgi:hypothetical protein
MPLRFTDDVEEDMLERSLPEPSRRLTHEDTFHAGDFEVGAGDDEEGRTRLLTRLVGPLIAAATFAPTFLAVFLGLPYLLTGVVQLSGVESARVPDAPRPHSVDVGSRADHPPRTLSEAIRDPFVPATPPGPAVTGPSEPRGTTKGPGVAQNDAPPSSLGAIDPPSLPPVRAPRADLPAARQPRPAPPPPAPAAHRDRQDWTPAAAFRDREAADRLASSIRRQGYPVQIREDASAPRPWVVWIGARPGGAEPRR